MTDFRKVPFATPEITERDIAAVTDVMRSGWLTTGPQVRAFEREFAQAVGARYAVALNSCTAALHLALEASGVGPGDEVIVPTLTFAATAEVVRYLGAMPVLVDVNAEDHCISVGAVQNAITRRTKAVIPVHFSGRAADLYPLKDICAEHGLALIEDAAHAFPATYQSRPVGSVGDATCFSFYVTKTITTGEGGMLVTDDAGIAERARMMSLHGLSRDAWGRYSERGNWYYEIVAPGYKYNMTDLAAALGREQLRRAEAMRERRQAIAERYTAAFELLPGLSTPLADRSDKHAWHLYVLKVNGAQAGIGRDALINGLGEAGIGTSVHFIPLHLHPYYRDNWAYKPEQFPVALSLYERSVSLPIYSAMTDADVEHVVSSVQKLCTAGSCQR